MNKDDKDEDKQIQNLYISINEKRDNLFYGEQKNLHYDHNKNANDDKKISLTNLL